MSKEWSNDDCVLWIKFVGVSHCQPKADLRFGAKGAWDFSLRQN